MPGNDLTTDAIFLACIEQNPQNSKMSNVALIDQGLAKPRSLLIFKRYVSILQHVI
jgi:hypothetical protein